MTALALRSASSVNAVSELHGQVTRSMWSSMWPDRAEDDVPVGHITNGVHVPTWIAAELNDSSTKHLGPAWLDRQDDPALWDAVLDIPDEELWAVRQSLRRYLFVVHARARPAAVDGRTRGHAPYRRRGHAARTRGAHDRIRTAVHRLQAARDDLPGCERLAKILSSPERPVQIVFAGKSHPADEAGKHHLQRVYKRALDPAFGGRIAFVDDYDLHVAHFLVQGCDVWLNNPRKPLEASGTSGMKAALNGVPHLSIGDGWWAEGYNGHNGWVIDGGVSGDDFDAVDAADAASLYRLLEEEIVPAYYDRGPNGVSRRWLAIVKESIRTVAPRFSARRMVKDYVERMYAPAIGRKLEVGQ